MGKSNRNQHFGEKESIPKEKLTDAHFNRIVTETSSIVCRAINIQNSIAGGVSSEPNASLRLDVEAPSGSVETGQLSGAQINRLDQPKRPMNAFMVWGQAIRRNLHDRYSNIQNALLSKALGRVWRTLDSTTKEPFVARANTIKADHKLLYPAYRYQPRRLQERQQRRVSTIDRIQTPQTFRRVSNQMCSSTVRMKNNYQTDNLRRHTVDHEPQQTSMQSPEQPIHLTDLVGDNHDFGNFRQAIQHEQGICVQHLCSGNVSEQCEANPQGLWISQTDYQPQVQGAYVTFVGQSRQNDQQYQQFTYSNSLNETSNLHSHHHQSSQFVQLQYDRFDQVAVSTVFSDQQPVTVNQAHTSTYDQFYPAKAGDGNQYSMKDSFNSTTGCYV